MSSITMDVLSEILALSHVSGSVLAEIECRGEWAIDMLDRSVSDSSNQYIIPFHYVLEGECYLLESISGTDHSLIRPGDIVVAPSWPSHILTSRPAVAPTSITEIISANGQVAWDGGKIGRPLAIVAGTGECSARILSGVFNINGHAIDLLISQIPPLLKLSVGDETLDEQLATALSFIRQEGKSERPGYVAVAERLTDLLFIQILRSCMATTTIQMGLLAALADNNVARALKAIHANPEAAWTVAALAKEAHMSRTTFAERFRTLAGVTPIQYVNHWRMTIAQDLLLRSDLPIGEIQARLGFSTSFAFSRAFRQAFGKSPRSYRKTADEPSAFPLQDDLS